MPTASPHEPVSFDQVYRDEFSRLRPQDRPSKPTVNAGLLGLALSGGGIRSATFGLGLLQGLAKRHALGRFDYLSGVSGGAYIGTWLLALLHRVATRGSLPTADAITAVESTLAGHARDLGAPEPPAIHHLREYSNYLTPRPGLLSADTWTFIAGLLAHLVLNLLVIVTVLATLIALFRLHIFYLDGSRFPSPFHWQFWAAGTLVCFALVFEWINAQHLLARMEDWNHGVRSGPRHLRPPWADHIYVTVVLPILASAWLISVWLAHMRLADDPTVYGAWTIVIAGVYFIICLVAWTIATLVRAFRFPTRASSDIDYGSRGRALRTALKRLRVNIAAYFMAAAVAGAVAGILFFVIADLFPGPYHHHWCFPLVILAYLATDLVHTGLAGNRLPAEMREWRMRLGSSLIRFGSVVAFLSLVIAIGDSKHVTANTLGWASCTWLGLTGLIYLARRSLAGAENMAWLRGWLGQCTSILVVGGVIGALAGLADVTVKLLVVLIKSDPDQEEFYILRVLLFIGWAGVVCFVASVTRRWLTIATVALLALVTWYVYQGEASTETTLLNAYRVAALLMFALAVVLAWRIDVNEFSAHGLYKNRLSRCYLGASNDERQANPFTDLDVEDDRVRLADLAASKVRRPYPIFNAALNLVRGDQLAWQDRMAASFVLTPLYCGYQPGWSRSGGTSGGAYQRAATCGDELTLGTVMAVSGAAVSPSMGFYSSGARAFLLAVFNFRLGRWLGNPRFGVAWRAAGPRFGFWCLASELLGLTNDRGRWVYLSDGGHFEVLGVYELLKRKCKCIVASDATADPDYRFEGLFDLVRKARTDLGVEIDIGDVSVMRPGGSGGSSQRHYCKMAIEYPGGESGALLYVKASITGDEAAELLDARRTQPGFPHQSTGDQFFSEEQFEAYRQLGCHIGEEVGEEFMKENAQRTTSGS